MVVFRVVSLAWKEKPGWSVMVPMIRAFFVPVWFVNIFIFWHYLMWMLGEINV